MVGRGRRHVQARRPALAVEAFVPAAGVQEALMQHLQLALHACVAVRAQDQGAEVLGLGPDAPAAVARRAVNRERGSTPPSALTPTSSA